MDLLTTAISNLTPALMREFLTAMNEQALEFATEQVSSMSMRTTVEKIAAGTFNSDIRSGWADVADSRMWSWLEQKGLAARPLEAFKQTVLVLGERHKHMCLPLNMLIQRLNQDRIVMLPIGQVHARRTTMKEEGYASMEYILRDVISQFVGGSMFDNIPVLTVPMQKALISTGLFLPAKMHNAMFNELGRPEHLVQQKYHPTAVKGFEYTPPADTRPPAVRRATYDGTEIQRLEALKNAIKKHVMSVWSTAYKMNMDNFEELFQVVGMIIDQDLKTIPFYQTGPSFKEPAIGDMASFQYIVRAHFFLEGYQPEIVDQVWIDDMLNLILMSMSPWFAVDKKNQLLTFHKTGNPAYVA